jgi:hypothetical protein
MEYLTNEALKAYEDKMYKYFLEIMEILQGKLQENFGKDCFISLDKETLKLHLYLNKNIISNLKPNGMFHGSSNFEFEIGVDSILDKTFYIKSNKFDYNVKRKFDQELSYEIFIKEISGFLQG